MKFQSLCFLAIVSLANHAQPLISQNPSSNPSQPTHQHSVILEKRGWLDHWRERRERRRENRERRYAELNAPIPVSQTQQVITTVDGPNGPVVVDNGPGPVGLVPFGGPIGPIGGPVGPIGGPIVGPPTLFKRGWVENHRERVHARRMARQIRFAQAHAPIPVGQPQQVITTVDGAPPLFKRSWWERNKQIVTPLSP